MKQDETRNVHYIPENYSTGINFAGMNFKVRIPDYLLEDPAAYVTLDFNEETSKLLISECTVEEDNEASRSLH